MTQDYRKKIIMWFRIAGWLCLLPASTWLYFYQLEQSSSYGFLFLIGLIIIILFALYILITAKSDRWKNPKKVLSVAIFALIFVSLLISIPLFIAYFNCKRLYKD